MQRAPRPVADRSRFARIAGIIALAACAGGVLAGCRSAPDVAAYVAGQRITEAQIDSIIADAKMATKNEQGTKPPSREAVVTTLTLAAACQREQTKAGFHSGEFSTDQIKQREQVPAASQYAAQRAAMYACLIAVPVGDATTPTEAELRALYDRANAARLVSGTFEQMKEQLANDTSVRQVLTINRALSAMVRDGDVTVNPRYRQMEFGISDLGSGVMLVTLEIGEPASDSVQDID